MPVDDKRPLKVFLCHAHADRDAVKALYTRLTKDGVDAWLDKEKLLPGQDWELEIRKAVREADVVVVCLSKQFNQAGFRQKEVRLALDTAMEKPEGEIFIIPARLEECDTLESLRKWHQVDLFEDGGYEMLMRALRTRADKVGVTLRSKKKRTPKKNNQEKRIFYDLIAHYECDFENTTPEILANFLFETLTRIMRTVSGVDNSDNRRTAEYQTSQVEYLDPKNGKTNQHALIIHGKKVRHIGKGDVQGVEPLAVVPEMLIITVTQGVNRSSLRFDSNELPSDAFKHLVEWVLADIGRDVSVEIKNTPPQKNPTSTNVINEEYPQIHWGATDALQSGKPYISIDITSKENRLIKCYSYIKSLELNGVVRDDIKNELVKHTTRVSWSGGSGNDGIKHIDPTGFGKLNLVSLDTTDFIRSPLQFETAKGTQLKDRDGNLLPLGKYAIELGLACSAEGIDFPEIPIRIGFEYVEEHDYFKDNRIISGRETRKVLRLLKIEPSESVSGSTTPAGLISSGSELPKAEFQEKAVDISSQNKRPKPQKERHKLKTEYIVAIIGAVATIVGALISSPAIANWFSPPPVPTATMTFAPTASETADSQEALIATAVVLVTQTLNPALITPEVYTPTATPTTLPTEITDAKGVSMMLVPEGEFTMGSDNGEASEKPAHKVYLDSFYIDKYEVTNILYKACVNVRECDLPIKLDSETRSTYYEDPRYEYYPVIHVTWSMAENYCAWRGLELPTEAQWEKAARGSDERTYPWGEGIDCNKGNYCEADTTEVGSYLSGISPYGVYDLIGNVWEWVGDWYSDTYYQTSPYSNPMGPGSGDARVLRGGSWNIIESVIHASLRYGYDPELYRNYNNIYDYGNYIGFRCVRNTNP